MPSRPTLVRAVMGFMHVFESVRHALESCARCTGSTGPTLDSRRRLRGIRAHETCDTAMMELLTFPSSWQIFQYEWSTGLHSMVSLGGAQIKPHRLAADVINIPSRVPDHHHECNLSLRNPLQPKGHLRESTQGYSYDIWPGSDMAELQFPDREITRSPML